MQASRIKRLINDITGNKLEAISKKILTILPASPKLWQRRVNPV
jgi:hypothetical protein